MKNSILRLVVAAGAFVCLPNLSLLAADAVPATTDSAPQQPVIATTAAVPAEKLPYGAEDVAKLSRAQISDDVILNYVQNAGTIYNLTPKDIVALKNDGVSDRVITAMLGQRKQVEASAQTAQAAQAIANAPTIADAPAGQVAPQYVVAPTYVEPQPSSSVYVIASPSVQAAYYGSYTPYYYGSPYRYYGPSYGGYCGPVVSFGFGFGGGGYYHGGGYHGGGYHGGGYHGGHHH
jgi:hypothetical protein